MFRIFKKGIGLCFLFLIGLIHLTFGQTVNNFPLQKLPAKYIDVTIEYAGKDLYYVLVDYGQPNIKYKQYKQSAEIKDQSGSAMKFNSEIAALNFLNKFGYSLKQIVYHKLDKHDSSDDISYTYLMEKNPLAEKKQE